MKILYVILTCEKYLNTRVKWQKESWAKSVPVAYLVEPVGEEVYNNAPLKYIPFFKTLVTDFDWFFFCDDDTFVDTKKLKWFLETQVMPDEEYVMIGFSGGTFPIHNLKITWCSGGAGIAMSRELVKKIQSHLRNTENPLVTHETDISLAIWATMAAKDLVVIDNKRFSPFKPHESPENCITYHYCTEQDFIRLNR